MPALKDSLIIEELGQVPAVEMRALDDGHIWFRYLVKDGSHPGFDGEWRIMSENERREHLHMGGKIADWLTALSGQKEGNKK